MRAKIGSNRFSAWWVGLPIIYALQVTVIAAAGNADLADAVKGQDKARVQALIKQATNVNAAQLDGSTALHWAVYWDDLETVERLISAGANVNASNDLGVTPLFLASTQEDSRLLTGLLKAGANPNAAVMSGESPLMAAARTGRIASVKALLAHGASVNAKEPSHDQTALMWAVVNCHPDVVQALLDAGADIHARSRIRRRKALVLSERQASYNPGAYEQHVKKGEIIEVEEGGFTPLLFAAQKGDIGSARLLLAAGEDVNETAPIGMSGLVIAAYSNNADFGKFLLDKGADPNSAAAGYTALHAAILRGNLELVKALLAHKADPNSKITKANGARRQSADYSFGNTLVGATPLYLAAKFGEVEIMRVLAANGADLHFAMPDGSTPMMAAMNLPWTDSGATEGLGRDRRDRYIFFRLIKTESPDDFTPQTPEEEERDALAMVQMEVAAGVNVNAARRDGTTAMHLAAAEGLNHVIDILFSHGANLNPEDRRHHFLLMIGGAPRRNRGGDLLPPRLATAALLRSLGGKEGEVVPIEDARRRR